MNFLISKDFARRIIGLTWNEIAQGLHEGWIDPGAAVDRAVSLVEAGEVSKPLLDLASLSDFQFHDVVQKVEELASKPITMDHSRLAKIGLAALYENRDSLSDPLLEIEILYADSNYPECIAHLVRYMPNDEEPRDLLAEWAKYVAEEVYGKEVISKS